VGRDVGRDEGRDQATWRELVARLELPAQIDPADTPWPDRENLRTKASHAAQAADGEQGTNAGQQAGAADDRVAAPQAQAGYGGVAPGGGAQDGAAQDGAAQDEAAQDEAAETAQHEAAQDETAGDGPGQDLGKPADRSRVIRPAAFMRFSDPAPGDPADDPAAADGTSGDLPNTGGPRDYDLPDADEFDLDDRYIPPPLPPQPKLDPVAKGAWLALFGGPGYLLLGTLLGWQLSGWAELTAVAAFIGGFLVLVLRLGDGPSKRDGPDQGAVV
jgi:hypothetical protein